MASIFIIFAGINGYIGRSHTRLNHLRDHMIKLKCILTCDNWSSEPLFQIFSSVARNGAADLCYPLVGFEPDGLLLLRKFDGVRIYRLE